MNTALVIAAWVLWPTPIIAIRAFSKARAEKKSRQQALDDSAEEFRRFLALSDIECGDWAGKIMDAEATYTGVNEPVTAPGEGVNGLVHIRGDK